jgi:5-formyltetrahydrofolate cyclo-ligase
MTDKQASLPQHPLASPTTPYDRQQLRRTMRQQRKGVPGSVARAASQDIARHLSRQIIKGQRIAIYLAFDGEIDLSHFVRYAQRLSCTLYAPRIVNMHAKRMEFIELHRQGEQQANRFSILEPRNHLHRRIDPRKLDVVLLPLVAFDMHGWRLGFGAGFYDRKLSFLRRKFCRKPLLIGVSYEFQRVPPQTPGAWDVLLDAVVTERGFQRCRPLHTP